MFSFVIAAVRTIFTFAPCAITRTLVIAIKLSFIFSEKKIQRSINSEAGSPAHVQLEHPLIQLVQEKLEKGTASEAQQERSTCTLPCQQLACEPTKSKSLKLWLP
eukprot:scpid43840/ scgid3670/ 